MLRKISLTNIFIRVSVCVCTDSGRGGTFDFLSVYYPEEEAYDNRGKRREEIRGATTEIPTEIPEHGNRARSDVSREKSRPVASPPLQRGNDEKVLSIARPPSPARNP